MRPASTLLVLGVGGNVSQGILKALAASSVPCKVVGACVSAHSVGLYACDQAVISPFADDPHFAEWLIVTCREHRVSGILSGVEPVLSVLARRKEEIEKQTGARVIVSPPGKLAICDDKLETSEWLRKNGLNSARSADAQDAASIRRLATECGFPLFAKPRLGKGARGITLVENSDDLAAVARRPGYVVQEYLDNAEGEFTAATFTDRDGNLRGSIVFRRQLFEGTTISAQVVDCPEVQAEVAAIAQALKPTGPCNMQLRFKNGHPVCFEINLRYSGTAPIRARLGFNDVEAGVRHFILGEPAADLPHVTRGAALRYWNEIYVIPEAIEACERDRQLANPRDAVEHVEPFGKPS